MFLDDSQLEPLYIYAFYTHAFSFPISFSQKKKPQHHHHQFFICVISQYLLGT